MDEAAVRIDSEHVDPVHRDFRNVFVKQPKGAHADDKQQDALKQLEQRDVKQAPLPGAFSAVACFRQTLLYWDVDGVRSARARLDDNRRRSTHARGHRNRNLIQPGESRRSD